jgi:hypothetical protein
MIRTMSNPFGMTVDFSLTHLRTLEAVGALGSFSRADRAAVQTTSADDRRLEIEDRPGPSSGPPIEYSPHILLLKEPS